MIYLTGDIHGDPQRIVDFSQREQLTDKDVIILLGDVGANYFGGDRDKLVKRALDECGPKMLCVHGNHEMRPWNVPGYELEEWHGGKVWVQKDFPNLLFAKDGEIFDLDGLKCIAIGGAYSVDKPMRLARGYGWWEDEQPSDEIKKYVECQLRENDIDVILSHTCPLKYVPVEMFLPGINPRKVDDRTEQWLDVIEDSFDYKAWYCGHWHTDKQLERIFFLYRTFLKMRG